MSQYKDRIIEVLNGNNVWQAVSLPYDMTGNKKESLLFSSLADQQYDVALTNNYGVIAKPIETEKLSEAVRVYISRHGNIKRVYTVSLTAMKAQTELLVVRYYNQLSERFHSREYYVIMNAILGKKKEEGTQYWEDQFEPDPQAEYDRIVNDLLEMNGEIAKIEALARYFGGVDDEEKIRVVFFGT